MPISNIYSSPENIRCEDYFSAAMILAKNPIYKKVVLAGNWYVIDDAKFMAENEKALVRKLLELRRLGKEVFIISNPPHSPLYEPSHLAKPYRLYYLLDKKDLEHKDIFIDRATLENSDAVNRKWIYMVANKASATLINPYSFFCFQDGCPIQFNHKAVKMNEGHFRASFVAKYATFIDELVEAKNWNTVPGAHVP
jgi:hypothetical protein